MAERLERVADGAWHAEASEEIAAKAEELVAEEFAQSKDPSGTPWWPTVRGNKPLIGKTTELSKSAVGIPAKQGIGATINSSSWKADFHQAGTYMNGRRHIPARPIVPVKGRTDGWGTRLWDVAAAVLRRWLGGT